MGQDRKWPRLFDHLACSSLAANAERLFGAASTYLEEILIGAVAKKPEPTGFEIRETGDVRASKAGVRWR
jgi:hypothetical protein